MYSIFCLEACIEYDYLIDSFVIIVDQIYFSFSARCYLDLCQQTLILYQSTKLILIADKYADIFY